MATKKAAPKKKKQRDVSRHIKTFWKIFAGCILVFILFFLFASWGLFGSLPDETSLENPEKNLATEIISSDGKTIGKFYKENRTPVPYDSLPDHLINALVATEDVRFYEHSGIDGRGTVRAIAFLGSRGGASTITQQLAKLFFTDQRASNKVERVLQKIKEWIIATRLERRYTKEEIITMYFNEYDFLNQAVGIESAAHIYFDKPPSQLSTAEAAMLVGMFKNSSLFNPNRRPELVRNRRNVVLAQMEKYNYISETVMDSLQALPLNLNFTPQGHDEGSATYFREYARQFMEDWIKEHPKSDGSKYNIYEDGLKVYVTIDSKMQEYAEQAVKTHMTRLQKAFDEQNEKNKTAPFRDITEKETEHIMNSAMRKSDRWREMTKQGKDEEEIIKSFKKKVPMRVFSWKGDIDTIMTPMDSIRYHKSFLQAAMMSMTPQTGEVKAWVGGIDYKHYKYDMVKKGRRQIGSTFKPFVYATAMDQMHMSPCDTLPNTLYTIPAGKHHLLEPWTPKNSGGGYGGMVTLKYALANSINTITARLIDRVGPEPVIDLVKKMGVDTKNMPAVPSIALGTADLSVYEMVGAYSTFANEGVYIEPILIQRIEDKNGTVLYQNVPKTKDVISNETAYVTVSLMEGVTQSGTGARLRGTWAKDNAYYKSVITGYPYDFKNPIAGKTGTTQNNSDGWFMGMVPNLVTGVWVGGDDRATHFGSTRYGQGATMALPIWGTYMKSCYADEDLDVSTGNFKRPANLSIETDCSKWRQGNPEVEEIPDEFDF
ncbi:PBP1A family penicillin-binding protein [Aequorivita sp. F47161]|uniref:PBP1A family penicillin-binding protein n=1 Tax=Aequorivita vitellina TaxID=2874475 RepID=A0A9X1TZ35_9FLAO|nr:PBP1A family penicillin-binding protein [Aequorivita vitellina]MCG2417619.1 PBP1A family penicillin-binding protein [Aequorivita vitellina]MCZ4317839.1 PBP1A family penicillin-binding protein [Aequorivita viscosa]